MNGGLEAITSALVAAMSAAQDELRPAMGMWAMGA
jgi:hypothetical protein